MECLLQRLPTSKDKGNPLSPRGTYSLVVLADWMLAWRVAFCLLEDLTAFYLKILLHFASRPHCLLFQDLHCVLLEDLTAFCLKTSLRFASSPHCVLLQVITAFCFNITGKHRTYEDPVHKKKRYDADVRATNIVLQGLPKDIYKLINHNIEAKAIWDNMLPSENINEYYVRFYKLVNDMRNIGMTMPNIQLNSKFVNNMSPEWDRFVTAVKLNKGLKETNHEQLYAYLKQHEKHAAQDRLIIERITPATNDQLAFVSTVQPHAQSSHVQSHQYPSSSTNPQSLQYPQFPETSQIDSGYTQTDEILDNLTKQMALLA
ncbi:hypothetical protein Tco_0283140 [Tanacetum coccineum]